MFWKELFSADTKTFDVFYHQFSDSITHDTTFLVRWNLAKKRLKKYFIYTHN